jgi:predicted RNA-binding Zn-ribbon protein involved in translation (DUF1610 family)
MSRVRPSTCISCGDSYQFTNKYKGNYCPDCHDDWSSRRPEQSRPRAIPPRATPSVRRIEDEETDPPSRYDRE